MVADVLYYLIIILTIWWEGGYQTKPNQEYQPNNQHTHTHTPSNHRKHAFVHAHAYVARCWWIEKWTKWKRKRVQPADRQTDRQAGIQISKYELEERATKWMEWNKRVTKVYVCVCVKEDGLQKGRKTKLILVLGRYWKPPPLVTTTITHTQSLLPLPSPSVWMCSIVMRLCYHHPLMVSSP